MKTKKAIHIALIFLCAALMVLFAACGKNKEGDPEHAGQPVSGAETYDPNAGGAGDDALQGALNKPQVPADNSGGQNPAANGAQNPAVNGGNQGAAGNNGGQQNAADGNGTQGAAGNQGAVVQGAAGGNGSTSPAAIVGRTTTKKATKSTTKKAKKTTTKKAAANNNTVKSTRAPITLPSSIVVTLPEGIVIVQPPLDFRTEYFRGIVEMFTPEGGVVQAKEANALVITSEKPMEELAGFYQQLAGSIGVTQNRIDNTREGYWRLDGTYDGNKKATVELQQNDQNVTITIKV